MNEPFDVEISRALKESAVKSLEGWEFTPALRTRVMDQIRAEAAADAAPASPPSRRPDLVRMARPLALVAAAAAAVMLVVNFGLPGVSKKEAPATMETAMSAAPTAPPMPSNEATTTQDTKAAPASAPEKAGAGQSFGSPSPKAVAPVEAQRAQLALELTVPADARTDAPQALMAPGKSRSADPSSSFTVMATSNIGGGVSGGGAVVTLTPFSVKAVDAANATVWERPLADLNRQSVVAASADGRAAVANGGDLLYLVNNRGDLDKTVHTGAVVEELQWSNDGRVAAAEGAKVVVYGGATGDVQFTVTTHPGSQVAFASDGMLAVFESPDFRHLELYDAKGRAVFRARPAVDGRGLVFAGDGQILVAGGQAYDRAGNSLWQLPLRTLGVSALGADRIVAWDARTVMTVNARDGRQLLWRADWKGSGLGISKVVSAPDGSFVVIVARVDDGAVLWVVSADGRQLLTEKLGQMPIDLGVAGRQVVLILPGSVEYRAVPQ